MGVFRTKIKVDKGGLYRRAEHEDAHDKEMKRLREAREAHAAKQAEKESEK